MGLLDNFNFDDPKTMGLLSAAAQMFEASGPSRVPVSLGQVLGRGLSGGMETYYGVQDQRRKQKSDDMTMRKQQLAIDAAEQEARLQQQITQAGRDSMLSPESLSLSGGGGPTAANAAKIPNLQPRFDQRGFMDRVMAIDPLKGLALQASMGKDSPFGKVDPKDFTQESVANFARTNNYADLVPVRKKEIASNGQVYDPFDIRPGQTFANPNQPFSVGADGGFVPNVPFQNYEISKSRAGAPSVSVNTSDPTAVAKAGLSMQNDVRTAFKSDNAIAGAYKLMQRATENPSPQGDTTLLYSFFKVLDPESTVREGELDLVMSSRSIPDKYKAYAEKIATGQQLLPKEREDILTQARQMVVSKVPRADQEVAAYRENASRLGLDPQLYAPHPYAGIRAGIPGREGLDTSRLSPQQVAFLKKQDPQAFANGVSNFQTGDYPKQPKAGKPAGGMRFDGDKEARYQAWKAQNGK